ncbi:efflux RND transporter periplasmic adaptor subunit [Pedobacter zeae]|uniref:RND family efflux transporter MFP subunit n=1 Tax=Pedobacter zeae TaxID=1737356 RepID=A0A7W6KGN3_9SPHI|nr:efflux RND transporter periplasmic adaptor subunit [Pedobacter zeae]MBB4110345.1 RND family efflux transporter MFP subunit [Pedobacter zeae]GGH17425.1 RND transporter MFP subunit [Pedobacter zeae]
MKKIFIYQALLAAVFSISACSNHKTDTAGIGNQDTVPVKVMPLQVEDASHAIAASGQFTTNDETFLSFKNGGIINRILVKEGDAVHQGQLLAIVNQTEISAQVQQVNLAYQKAERDYSRASKLYKDSVATLEQMQNAKTALQVAKQQLDAVKFNQNYSEIRATSSGYVLKKLANDGQIVGPGTPVLQINGAKQNKWILKVGLSDAQWAALKIGDGATITTDALPNQTLSAKVSRKAEGIDPQSGTFGVELSLIDVKVQGLAAGLFGKATIIPTKTSSGYTIPYDALLDGGENEGYVFITNDNKTAQKVKVQLGAIQNDKINITGGLENAAGLIVSGSAYLTDGSKIKVLK